MTASVIRASAPVTPKAPVGEPPQGTSPHRLRNRMKKNSVQRNGRKRSASWLPIAGRATSSRMNRTITSNMFHNRPRGGRPAASLPPQRNKDRQHHHSDHQLHDHELGQMQGQADRLERLGNVNFQPERKVERLRVLHVFAISSAELSHGLVSPLVSESPGHCGGDRRPRQRHRHLHRQREQIETHKIINKSRFD